MLILWGLKDWAAVQQGGTHQKGLRCAGWTVSQNSSCFCGEEDKLICSGGLHRTEVLWFIIYRINRRVAFCWKAPSYYGWKKIGGKRRRKAGKAGENKDIGEVSCSAGLSHCATLALSCPLLCSLPLQLAELRRCACSLSAGQAVSQDRPLPQHQGQPTESPHRKIQYLGLQESHLSLPKPD